MRTLALLLNDFRKQISGIDTSIDENYLRLPKYLLYEKLDDLELKLNDLFIANK